MIIENKKVEFLVKNTKLDQIAQKPYNKEVCNFLVDFSKKIDDKNIYREFPDIKALSFWCRKGNIDKLIKNNISNELRVGLGIIFHITPSNIPTNFMYSLIFGLLTGNSNIIKVPSKKFKQIDFICKKIEELLKKKYKSLRKRICIIRYKEDEALTKLISLQCNARLIWGGDKTINEIRKISLNPRALELTFSDRYSLSVIDIKSLTKINKNEFSSLVEKFYNDTFIVDQNACSSPQMILWHGKYNKKVQEKFWSALADLVSKKYTPPDNSGIEKHNQLFENFISLKNINNFKIYKKQIYTVSLNNLNKEIHKLRGKWGYFYEFNTSNLKILENIVNTKYQTLSYYGISKSYMNFFFSNTALRGIDRIVPIGQALNINLFWDGYDLNKVLTRIIDIR
jgi:hypothetical protein